MRPILIAVLFAFLAAGCVPRVRPAASEATTVPPLDRSQVPATAAAGPTAEPRVVVVDTRNAPQKTVAATAPTNIVITAQRAEPTAGSNPGAVLRSDTVSASAGEVGGVVVLWPRIVPASEDPVLRQLAEALQGRMSRLAARALPSRPTDVRPAPERSCPQGGCKGVSVGAVLAHRDGACVAVVFVSQPGEAPANLVAWGGKIELKQPQAPFREPPESYFTVKDFARCDTLLQELDSSVPEQTIRAVGQ